MTQFSKHINVYYVEEHVVKNIEHSFLEVHEKEEGILVIIPVISFHVVNIRLEVQYLLKEWFRANEVVKYVAWYYTPMALPFTEFLKPEMVVFDCMDELTAFKFAPPELKELETALLAKADIVFAGGNELYKNKVKLHNSVHLYPSRVDADHFMKSRQIFVDPADQTEIPYPRIGFFGVLDERLDINLLEETALARPDWHFVMVGPTVKIDPTTLPNLPNIHYLGSKRYAELPNYLAGWQVAWLPFAMNESTKFISPTKLPEYLAANKPVVSTPLTDVINPYKSLGFVKIVSNAIEAVEAIEALLASGVSEDQTLKVDIYLKDKSWKITAQEMEAKMLALLNSKQNVTDPQRKQLA